MCQRGQLGPRVSDAVSLTGGAHTSGKTRKEKGGAAVLVGLKQMGRLGGPTAARLGYWVGSVARLAGWLGSAKAGRLAWLDLADWIGSAPWAPSQAAAHFFFLFFFLLLFTSISLTKRARWAALLLLLSLACGSQSTAKSSSGEWLGPGWVRLLRRGEARHGGRSRGARGH